ncbi:hypothetical protein K501DRAFT_187989 [Backusella circina FSU 941]|nr:hypothetical protein K501DRAFT_187989 [Backusella circina FSU 941]
MDTLYTNFIRYPGLIHANSKPSHYETEMNWRFQNKEWKLHSGYADFRYGAYVPRDKVQTFLTQLGKSSLDKRHIQEAEVYFPIWVNQYPWLLNNQVYTSNHYDAVHYLQRILEKDVSDTPQDYFDRFEEQPPVEYRETKASCGNDKCLFMTNMDPFVSPEQVEFDHRTVKSISALERTYGKISKIQQWEEHGYHKAVDSDPNTCWNTVRGPKQGDYFGLVIMGSVKTKQISIITPQEIAQPHKTFSISVLYENEWVSCTSHDETVPSSGRLKLSFKCSGTDFFRAIKVSFLKDQKEAFELCGLSLNDFTV